MGLSGAEREVAVLGIETSCDETAAAVVVAGTSVLSSVVSSQIDLHARFGGVVPEIAGRAHVELLTPVVAEALLESGLDVPSWRQKGAAVASQGAPVLGAVAATVGPGLIGSLLVGVSAAKALALVWEVPFVGVNHLEAHLYAASLENEQPQYPMIVLLVSGGHTILVLVEAPACYRMLGQTLDDAAGEAFDKVARLLGLGYPGGPAIDRLARDGDPHAVELPRALLDQGWDFSFSGLKTAVLTCVRAHPELRAADVAASFQEAVVDVCITKARRAAAELGARSICLAGGVAANSALRARAALVGEKDGLQVLLPSLAMCTDNAAMVAAAAWWRLRVDGPTPLSAGAVPSLGFPT